MEPRMPHKHHKNGRSDITWPCARYGILSASCGWSHNKHQLLLLRVCTREPCCLTPYVHHTACNIHAAPCRACTLQPNRLCGWSMNGCHRLELLGPKRICKRCALIAWSCFWEGQGFSMVLTESAWCSQRHSELWHPTNQEREGVNLDMQLQPPVLYA